MCSGVAKDSGNIESGRITMSLARLNTWMVSMINFFFESDHRGVHRQKIYDEMYGKKLDEDLQQI